MRNFLATLAFSQGVPMISHGDELGRTQHGNNNAYCQDNEITWVNWDLEDWQRELLTFARRIFQIRHANPVLRRRTFFRGQVVNSSGAKDLSWIRPDGQEMTQADWNDPKSHALGMLILGEAADEIDDRGRPVKGDTLLLLVNNGRARQRFALPAVDGSAQWEELANTAARSTGHMTSGEVTLASFSLLLLRCAPVPVPRGRRREDRLQQQEKLQERLNEEDES
jgi:glycogen operon protein